MKRREKQAKTHSNLSFHIIVEERRFKVITIIETLIFDPVDDSCILFSRSMNDISHRTIDIHINAQANGIKNGNMPNLPIDKFFFIWQLKCVFPLKRRRW